MLSRETFKQMLVDLESCLDLAGMTADVAIRDAVEYGSVHKFECASDLCGKLIKTFLFVTHGIGANSPQEGIKGLKTVGNINKTLYSKFIKLISDRKHVNYIQSETEFRRIYASLPVHLSTMKETLSRIT